MIVSEIMTSDPIQVSTSATIREVMEVMYSEEIRHLPVVDGRSLVGMISDRDLRSFSMPIMAELDNLEESNEMLEQSISTLMRGDVVTVEPETSVEDLIEVMIENRVGAVPVVTPDAQELVGIVSYIDVLKAAQSML